MSRWNCKHNKITNLKIAAKRLNGIVLQPGETFSYWRLIGSTTKRKGYVDGMILHYGKVTTGVGGGLVSIVELDLLDDASYAAHGY